MKENNSVQLVQVRQYFDFMLGRLYKTEVTVSCQLINQGATRN